MLGGVCCAVGAGLAGRFAALAGAGALASSKASNGCESLSWLVVDACTRCAERSETVAEASGAILGILGTWEPLQAT